VLPGSTQEDPFEVGADQKTAGLEEVSEGRQQLALNLGRFAAGRLDAAADVVVEERDGLGRGRFDTRSMARGEADQRTEGNPGLDQPEAGGEDLEILGWKSRTGLRGDWS